MIAGRQPPGRAAYTLVELLIVVTVLGILASIVVPALSSPSVLGLPAAARALAGDLRLASGLAVQYNTTYAVRFDSSTHSYELVHTGAASPPPLVNPSAPAGTPAGQYVVKIGDLAGTGQRPEGVRLLGVRLAAAGTSVTQISYGPQGGTGPGRAENTEIWLVGGSANRAHYARLTVSWLTGQVDIDLPGSKPAGW